MIYQSTTSPVSFTINPKTKENFDILLNGIIKYNQDAVIVIDGEEGSGKSQSVRQLGLYCAEQLNTPFDREGTGNIYTSMQAYMDAFEKAQEKGIRGWVGILDESRAVLGKAHHNQREVKAFTDWFSECRDIGGCHFILLPKYHDLHKYIVLNRMSLLINMRKEFRKNPSVLGGQELILGGYKLYPADNNLFYCYQNPYLYPSQYAVQDRFSDVEVMTPKGLEELKAQKKKDRENRKAENLDNGMDKGTVWLNGLMAVLQAEGYQAVRFSRLLGITKQAINQRIQAGKSTVIYRRFKGEHTGTPEEEE